MISLLKEWNIKTKLILRTGSRFDISLSFQNIRKKIIVKLKLLLKVLQLTKGGAERMCLC
jgi:hypothetical protein